MDNSSQSIYKGVSRTHLRVPWTSCILRTAFQVVDEFIYLTLSMGTGATAWDGWISLLEDWTAWCVINVLLTIVVVAIHIEVIRRSDHSVRPLAELTPWLWGFGILVCVQQPQRRPT